MHGEAAIAKVKSTGTDYDSAAERAQALSLEKGWHAVIQFPVDHDHEGRTGYRYAAVSLNWLTDLQLDTPISRVRCFANGAAL